MSFGERGEEEEGKKAVREEEAMRGQESRGKVRETEWRTIQGAPGCRAESACVRRNASVVEAAAGG